MKKLLNPLVIIFMLISLLSCSNPAGPNGNKNMAGINIPMANVIMSGCKTVSINRKRSSENEYREYIWCDDYNKDNIIDYFVEPNVKYDYRISFKNSKGEWSESEEVIGLSNSNGLGELKFEEAPIASFDRETGRITFEKMPKYSNVIEQTISILSGRSWNDINYIDPSVGSREWVVSATVSESIDCLNWIRNEKYEIDLQLHSIYSYVQINNYRFFNLVPAKDIPQVVQNINIKDTRIEIKSENSSEGVIITIPKAPSNVNHIEIHRGTDINNTGSWDSSISLWDYNNKIIIDKDKDMTITDYFVNSNTKYVYTVNYYNTNENWNIVLKSKPLEVTTGDNCKGELVPNCDLIGNYYNSNQEILFENNPKVKQEEFIKSKNANSSIIVNFNLVRGDLNNGWIAGEIVDGKINFNDSIKNRRDKEKIRGNPLIPCRIMVKANNLDDYNYTTFYYKESDVFNKLKISPENIIITNVD